MSEISNSRINQLIQEYGIDTGIYKYETYGQIIYAIDASVYRKKRNIKSNFDIALTKKTAYDILTIQEEFQRWGSCKKKCLKYDLDLLDEEILK